MVLMSSPSPSESSPAASNPGRQHVVVMGLMGSGKSTLGTALAARLGWRYSDSDQELEQRTGLTGAQFADVHGVDALHVIESALVLMALGSNEPTVITAAGSTIENDVVRRMIGARAVAAYLDVPVTELEQRHRRGTHRRSLKPGELTAQFDRRRPLFVEVADFVVPSKQSGTETVSALMKAVADD